MESSTLNIEELLSDKLEKGAVEYCENLTEEKRQNLLQVLQNNDCHELIENCVDGDHLSKAFVLAGENAHTEIIQIFLDQRMNIDVKDQFGNTALMKASSNGHEELVRLLLIKGAIPDIQSNSGGWTALIWASIQGHKETVQLLLLQNANPDLQGNDGCTALMCASEWNEIEIVQLLLNHGADINLKNKDGKNALDLAKTEEIKEMIQNHVNTSYILK